MKARGFKKLGLVAALGAACLVTGCANMPKPVKIALTPLTATRDAVDTPLHAMTRFFDYVAETGRGRTGDTTMGPYWNSHHGFGAGATIDVTYPAGKLFSAVFGVPDYLFCRSLYPNFPNGVSPWERDTWFPNTKALWKED